jgi:hypothetical protein
MKKIFTITPEYQTLSVTKKKNVLKLLKNFVETELKKLEIKK